MKRHYRARYCHSRATNELAFAALVTVMELLRTGAITPEQIMTAARSNLIAHGHASNSISFPKNRLYAELKTAAHKIGYGLFDWEQQHTAAQQQ